MKNRVVVVAVVALLLVAGLVSSVQAATLKVGATPRPHAEILELLVPVLAEQGITLEVIEFTDYVRPNLAVNDGDLDANYFQHVPYMNSFNEGRGTNIVKVRGVHVEPLGVYSRRLNSLDDIARNAQIAIPNDATNGGRALLLLQSAGLIKVDPSAGIVPTIFDITENRLNLRFVELEAAQLARSLDDVAAAVINGNYALEAGFYAKDALFLEGAESPYVNVLAVRADNTENPAIAQLAEALNSELVREFILNTYNGSVVPAF